MSRLEEIKARAEALDNFMHDRGMSYPFVRSVTRKDIPWLIARVEALIEAIEEADAYAECRGTRCELNADDWKRIAALARTEAQG